MAKRRSLEETRKLLLDTGVDLIVESGVTVTLDQVHLMDVSRAAGLKTAGSAYKIWSSQDAFRADLLHHLADATFSDQTVLEEIAALIRDADEVPPLGELIRTFARQSAETLGANQNLGLWLALYSASVHDPVVARGIHDSDHELFTSYAAIYAAVAERYDLEFVPPFDATTLATSIGALAEGFAIRDHVTPELVPDDMPRPTGPDGAGRAMAPVRLRGRGARAGVHPSPQRQRAREDDLTFSQGGLPPARRSRPSPRPLRGAPRWCAGRTGSRYRPLRTRRTVRPARFG